MQSPAPDPERCSGVKTYCCFPVLTWALPFALRTYIFAYIPLNPWGASALVHTKHGGINSSVTSMRWWLRSWWLGSAGLVSLCQEPAPTRDPVRCGGVMFPPATLPVSPLPGPGGSWEGQRDSCLAQALSPAADADEQTFPSALLRDALNPGSGWLLARPPKGPRGWLSSLLFFQRLQKAARLHLIQIY